LDPKISVLIATYNRAKILGETFEAMTRVQPPPGGWELIVADNNSSDGTRRVCHDWSPRLPLQYLFEPRQGKNYALNKALEYARGTLLVFTDDDVTPDNRWLWELADAAKRFPDAAIFGGSYRETVVGPAPRWIVKAMRGGCYFGGHRPREDTGPYPQGKAPHGVNLAIRDRLFRDYGYRYDPSIGPRGKGRVSGSESELLLRAQQDGLAMVYVATAVVYHRWYPHQFAVGRLCRRAFGIGRGEARLRAPDVPRLFGIPRYLGPLLVHHIGVCIAKILVGDTSSSLRSLFRVCRGAGEIYESCSATYEDHST